MKKILIIDDEPGVTLGLEDHLAMEGFEVETRDDGAKGLEAILDLKPDLVLLDVMMPKLNGFEVCKELRKRDFKVPIIMLTARGEEIDKVLGLELGADDYVTKPFGAREMVARIKAVLRRSGAARSALELTVLRFADVEVDFTSFQARRGGHPVELTAKEFQILRLFASRPSEVITRDEFLGQVWGEDVYITNRSVDNQVWAIRKKLESNPEEPKHFLSVRGIGYRFVPESVT